MRSHPGGAEHTRRMLALGELASHSRVLDMGAGAGETVALLRSLGFGAEGIDLEPCSLLVTRGDLLHAPWPDGSFEAVISQCAFFASGDQYGALAEAHRLLRKGGKLLLSDVFFEEPGSLLTSAGFTLLYAEDMTPLWREYFLEALWRDDAPCCEIPKGKSSYWLLIGRKDG